MEGAGEKKPTDLIPVIVVTRTGKRERRIGGNLVYDHRGRRGTREGKRHGEVGDLGQGRKLGVRSESSASRAGRKERAHLGGEKD